jgi:hypothetical protein
MPNSPISDHPLKGTTHTFRPDEEPYDPDLPRKYNLPGTLIVAPGMTVLIKAVFQNWNDVPGLDMFYVFCTGTGMHTHVTPDDLGLPALTPECLDCGSGQVSGPDHEGMFDCRSCGAAWVPGKEPAHIPWDEYASDHPDYDEGGE